MTNVNVNFPVSVSVSVSVSFHPSVFGLRGMFMIQTEADLGSLLIGLHKDNKERTTLSQIRIEQT